MPSHSHCSYSIRKAYPTEFSVLGDLTVDVYASLPGMPAVAEQESSDERFHCRE
jgi:hypothetical protein